MVKPTPERLNTRPLGACITTWALLIAAVFVGSRVAAADLQAIEGEWTNSSNSVVVSISPCESAICGYVTWASTAAQDDALQGGTTQLIGTQLLYDFVPAGPNRWRGTLFVPDLRRWTRARIISKGPDKLEVVGCEMAGLICKKQIWHRKRAL